MTWNDALSDNERVVLTEEVEPKAGSQPQLDLISDILGRKKRQATPPKSHNSTKAKSKNGDDQDYYEYNDDKDYESGVKTGTCFLKTNSHNSFSCSKRRPKCTCV